MVHGWNILLSFILIGSLHGLVYYAWRVWTFLVQNLFEVLSIHEIPWIHYLFVLFTILFGLCLKHPSPFVTLYINSNEFELSIKDSNWAQINPKLSLEFLVQLISNPILIINMKTNTNLQLNYSILLSTTQKVQPRRKII